MQFVSRSLLCPPTDLIIVRNSTLLLSWPPAHLLMFAPKGQLMLIAAAAKAILPLVPPPPTLAWLSSCTCLNIVGERGGRVPLIFVQYGNG